MKPTATRDPIEWVRERWELQDDLGDPQMVVVAGSLLRLHQIMTAAIDQALKPFDLNRNMYLLLTMLQLTNRGASLLSVLARSLIVHPTTVTLLTDKLEQQGLLIRSPHPTDRRAIYATITPAGRAVMKQATKALSEVDFGLTGLSATKARQLADLVATARLAAGDGMAVG